MEAIYAKSPYSLHTNMRLSFGLLFVRMYDLGEKSLLIGNEPLARASILKFILHMRSQLERLTFSPGLQLDGASIKSHVE